MAGKPSDNCEGHIAKPDTSIYCKLFQEFTKTLGPVAINEGAAAGGGALAARLIGNPINESTIAKSAITGAAAGVYMTIPREIDERT
jgi:hypothetical protein